MPGIGVIANPNARRNRRSPRVLTQLSSILGDQGELALTRDRDDILRTAERFKAQGVDLLCINGGDGTNHITLGAFLEVYGKDPLPAVAFLRGGTMNTTAWDCGLKTGSPQQLLKRIVDRRKAGQPLESITRHMLKVDNAYGFLFGNGVIANFLEAYYEGGDASVAKAVTTLSRGVASVLTQGPFARQLFERSKAEVRVDGQKWPASAWDTLAAGTIGHIGLGFYPFFRAVSEPGTLHILGAACGPMRVVKQLPNFFAARQQQDPEILDAAARRVEIECLEPFRYTLDGDMYTAPKQLVMEVGPRLTIVRG